MKKLLPTVAFTLLFVFGLKAQIVPYHPDQLKEKPPKVYKHQVYLELANLPIYSINYSYSYYSNELYNLKVHAGISPSTFLSSSSKLRVPIRLSISRKLEKNEINFALGLLPYLNPENDFFSGWENDDLALFAEIGYQFDFENGYFITPVFSPLLYDNLEFRFQPWGGIKLGKQF